MTLCSCGCGQQGHDMHHALIGRRKRFPELNAPRNLVPVNHWEHINRKFDNQKWRLFFWEHQCKKYGKDKMIEWVESCPTNSATLQDG